MRTILRLFDALITGLAVLAGAMVVAIFAAVTYDVAMRNVGLQPPAWTVPSAEYALLYITLLASPWLLRARGHVVIETLRAALPPPVRRPLELAIYVACLAVCGIIAWFSFDQFLESWVRGEFDQRAISVPLSAAYAPMLLSFFLMGAQFLRFLIGRETIYRESALGHEKL